jgi:hypothetical protein
MPEAGNWFGPGYRLRINSNIVGSPTSWRYLVSLSTLGGVVLDYAATYKNDSTGDWPSPSIGIADQLDVDFALYPAMFFGAHPLAGPGDTVVLGCLYLDSLGNSVSGSINVKFDNIGGVLRLMWNHPSGSSSSGSLAEVLAAVKRSYVNAP